MKTIFSFPLTFFFRHLCHHLKKSPVLLLKTKCTGHRLLLQLEKTNILKHNIPFIMWDYLYVKDVELDLFIHRATQEYLHARLIRSYLDTWKEREYYMRLYLRSIHVYRIISHHHISNCILDPSLASYDAFVSTFLIMLKCWCWRIIFAC